MATTTTPDRTAPPPDRRAPTPADPRRPDWCPLCPDSIKPGEQVGDYQGTRTHRICALEQQVADLHAIVAALRGDVSALSYWSN